MSTTSSQRLVQLQLNLITPAQWSDLFFYADEALRRWPADQLELNGEELTYRTLAAVLKAASSGDPGMDAPPDNFASTTEFLGWLRHRIQRHLDQALGQPPVSAPQLRREFAGRSDVLAVLNAWDAPPKPTGQRCAQPPPAGSETSANLHFEMKTTSPTESLPIVPTSTRAEVLAAGRLLDVTPLARQAGFQIPAALTASLWAAYGAPDKTPAEDPGTVWDLLWMLRCAATGILPAKLECHPHGEVLWFELELTPRGKSTAERVLLKAISGGGDSGESVLTICLPHEH